MSKNDEFDLVIVGAGGGGLAAAIAGRAAGASVCVIESGDKVGGTYAYSTGLVWMPANSSARAAGISDSAEEAESHIVPLAGGRADLGVLRAYMRHGPAILDFLATKGVPFEWIPRYPDYYSEMPGGRGEGRYLASPIFDPELLPTGWRSKLLESPYYTHIPVSWQEIQGWGGYASAGGWDQNLLASRRQKQIRGFGGATMGFLLRAALNSGVSIRLSSEVTGLLRSGEGRVTGVMVGDTEVRALRAVILASGGYEQDIDRQRMFDTHHPAVPLTYAGVKGGPMAAAMGIGAQFVNMGGQLLAPVYRGNDNALNFAAREISLPGGFVVNRSGQRFSNDAFYWSLAVGMGRFDPVDCSFSNMPAFLIFDQQWKDTYRLGIIAPGASAEWLSKADTAEELGKRLGLADHNALAQTIADFNGPAARGEDPAWHRGDKAYARNNGDARVTPNPCVRPLKPPYYGLQLELGTMGSLSGLNIDSDGRVLHAEGGSIPALYACGNAMANLVEGLWYTSGVSNGRGLVFGVLAARHAMSANA
jgi:3-oxosteroid 1-dehydrogenase